MAAGRPARVLYVHHRREVSGAARALALLVGALDRGRFEPHAYCPAGPAAALLRERGATVHEGPVAGFTHIWASSYHGLRWALLGREAARLPAHALGLGRLLRRGSFALAHLNDSPLLPAAALARATGLPVVWHLRSALPPGESRRSRLVRAAVRRLGAAAVAINRDVAASFGTGAAIVADPVDLERFAPGDAAAARERAGLPQRPTVSFFGYLYPAKGFGEFLRMAGLLEERGVDATYLVAGGGVRDASFFASPAGRLLVASGAAADHEREARSLAASLGLGERVRFLPYTPDPAPLYRASDVVVAPSQGPEVGLPALEAAAAGVPAVVSGSADGAGVVHHERTGLVVPDRSPPALADAVERLLADAALGRRLGAAAREEAERSFGVDRHARAVEEVYASVLARP